MALGLAVRLWWLDSAPAGALIDEAHFGYLAKSLLETGQDEHSLSWPLIFKGFGDQKLPANAYLFMPMIKLFGLSVLSIRLQSVIFGTLFIAAVYVLTRQLKFKHHWGLIASLITAISFWPFFLSRFGFESNTALLFFSLGLICLLQLIQRQNKYWAILAGSLMALSWYAYIAYRPVTLAISLVMMGFLLWQKRLNWRPAALFLSVFMVLVLPLFSPQANQANTARFEQIGILSDPGLALEINENRTFCAMKLPSQICYLVWNKPVLIVHQLGHNYLTVFSPQFLSTVGEGQEFLSLKHFGQLSLFLYPFFLIGLVALLRKSKLLQLSDEHRLQLLSGLFLSPLPNILVGMPQKVRLSPFLPFLIITITAGLYFTFQLAKKYLPKQVLISALSIFLLIVCLDSATQLIEFYSVHTTKHEYYYQSYVQDIFAAVAEYQKERPQTEVVIKPFFSDPLMFYAFYTDLPANLYQKQAVLGPLEPSGFQHTVELGQIKAYD